MIDKRLFLHDKEGLSEINLEITKSGPKLLIHRPVINEKGKRKFIVNRIKLSPQEACSLIEALASFIRFSIYDWELTDEDGTNGHTETSEKNNLSPSNSLLRREKILLKGEECYGR